MKAAVLSSLCAVLAVLTLSLGVAPARAMQYEGVQMADSLDFAGKKLLLNGMGAREATMFHVKVYIGGLYVEKTSHDPNEIISSSSPKKVLLTFVRDVPRQEIAKAWKESFERNAGASAEALKPPLAKLQSLMPDVHKGQTMTYNLYSDHVELLVDNRSLGTIEGGGAFNKTLLSAWIVKPPNDSLKTGMLGLRN